MATLHSDDHKISPTWTKVTVTPFSGMNAICSGYGKRLQNTSISADAPRYFINPDKVERPANFMSKDAARVTKLMVKSDSKDVLPGGESMRNVLTNPPSDQHRKFRSFPHDSFRIKPQMYMEPIITARPGDQLSRTRNPITQTSEGYFETSGAHNGARIPLSTWAKA